MSLLKVSDAPIIIGKTSEISLMATFSQHRQSVNVSRLLADYTV